jgi:hypothetical protein
MEEHHGKKGNTMNRPGIAALVALAAVVQGCSSTPPAPTGVGPTGLAKEEASIPFLSHSSIRNWEADGQDGVWVQDLRKKWYYGKLMAPCYGLDFATRIAFIPRGNSLDRFSSIVVPDHSYQSCTLRNFNASDAPPPKKARKAKAKAAEATATPPAK